MQPFFYNFFTFSSDFLSDRNQLMDRIAFRREFLLIFCHNISLTQFLIMMKVVGYRIKLPASFLHRFH